jgi:radical SAM protein with 4Fe4S-binding SPASM domain
MPAAQRVPKFQRQVRNLVRLTADLASGREEWLSHPYTLEYSTNNVCNLRCRHCAQHDGVPVVKVPRATSERILDEFLPEGGLLSPMALSEPFAGDMELYLAKCEEHDAYLNLITNGTLLTEEKLRRVMPRVARFFLSIESRVQRDFETLRVGAKFEKVEANARLAARIGKEHGVPVCFVTVLMEPVWRDLTEYVRWVHALGGTSVLVLELLPTYPRYEEHRVAGIVPEAELLAARDEALAVARELGLGLWFQMPPPLAGGIGTPEPSPRVIYVELAQAVHAEVFRDHGHFCHHLATYVKVDLDGTVYPCCRCPDELKMGNVNASSFAEIWNGPRYRELRRRMHSGDLPECCKGCAVLVGNPHYRKPGDPPPEDETTPESG